jgi:hypothetical protein
MEFGSGNGTSNNLKTSSSTNSNESELFNSKKKSEFSQDHIHLTPNATATTAAATTTGTPHSESVTFLRTNDQTNSSVIEKRDENSINSHLEANHANPFGEFHPTYPNTSNPSSLSSSSSQNPFLLLSDDGTINITHVNANESQNFHDQVPFEPRLHQSSTYESTHGNPFQAPTSTINDDDSQKIVEHHDRGNEWRHEDRWSFPSHETTSHQTLASSSSNQLDPFFSLESTQNQKLDNTTHKNHESETHPHASSASQQLDPWFMLESTQNHRLDSATDKNHEATTHTPHASSSSQQLEPFFMLESTQNHQLDNATDKNNEGTNISTNTFSAREQGHNSIASRNFGTVVI